MSDWQTIIDNLKTTLQKITIANGYNTDVGNNVQVWRLAPITEETDLPFIDVRDVTNASSDTAAPHPYRHHYLTVEVNVVTSTSTLMRKIVYDVLNVIGNNSEAFGTTNGSTDIGDITVDFIQDEVRLVMATIPLNIKYRTERWKI